MLRPDGVCFLNIGDSYAGGGKTAAAVDFQQKYAGSPEYGTSCQSWTTRNCEQPKTAGVSGLKPKNLVGQPWLLAFALRADGWFLRSDVIWAKENCMPESVDDRPTKSHEYIFVLAKGKRKTRIVKFADLVNQRFDFGQHLGLHDAAFKPVSICIALATAIFDRAQREKDFGLPPFYAQEWKHGQSGESSAFVADLPMEYRATPLAARFLAADISAEEFLQQLKSLRVALSDRNKLLIGDVVTQMDLSPVASWIVKEPSLSITPAA